MALEINQVWNFTLGTTATEENPWVVSTADHARIDVPTQRIIIYRFNGDISRAVGPGQARPFLGSYYFKYVLTPLNSNRSAFHFAYRDIASLSPGAEYGQAGFAGNTNVPGDVRLAGKKVFPNASAIPLSDPVHHIGDFNWFQIPDAPITMEVFWRNDAQLLNIRANYNGGSRETGFFNQVTVGTATYGSPFFDYFSNGPSGTDAIAIGNLSGAHDLTDAWVDFLAGLPPLSFNPIPSVIPEHSSILPASTAKISHARILAGYRSQGQAQAFHDIMRRAT